MKKLLPYSFYILLLVGTIVGIAYAQQDKTVTNRAQDKDLILEVNDGGTPTAALTVDGANATVGLNVETEISASTCAVGNVCSGSYTPTCQSNELWTGVSGGSGFWTLIGKNLTVTGSCNATNAVNPDEAERHRMEISIPFGSFDNNADLRGVCTFGNSTAPTQTDRTRGGTVSGLQASNEAFCVIHPPSASAAGVVDFFYMVELD